MVARHGSSWDKIYKPKMEYKPTGKSLTARQVVGNSKIDRDETTNFCKWLLEGNGTKILGLDCSLFCHPFFLPYALKHTCFRDFLLEGGYIEKVDAWVPVKAGDELRCGSEKYMIYAFAGTATLVYMNGSYKGMSKNQPVKIDSVNNITKEEFQKICGSIPIDELERI